MVLYITIYGIISEFYAHFYQLVLVVAQKQLPDNMARALSNN